METDIIYSAIRLSNEYKKVSSGISNFIRMLKVVGYYKSSEHSKNLMLSDRHSCHFQRLYNSGRLVLIICDQIYSSNMYV